MITGVTGSNGIERLALSAARADGAAAGRAEGAAPAKPQGAAELSPLARDMAASPPVDADKVQNLKDAIIRGDYRPDPMRIAEKMLSLAPGTPAA